MSEFETAGPNKGLRTDRHHFQVGDCVKLSRTFLKSTMMEDFGKMVVTGIFELDEKRSLVYTQCGRSILNLNLRQFKAKELE